MGKRSRKHRKIKRAKNMQTIYSTLNTDCHLGPRLAFKVGQSEVYGGSRLEVKHYADGLTFDLLLSMMGKDGISEPHVKQSGIQKWLPRIFNHLRTQKEPAYLAFDVADGFPPEVPARFWSLLAKDLQDKPQKVAVFCMGGHGRTGTALLALAHAAGVIPSDKDPLAWLRQTYCGEAVETQRQIDYLAKLGIHTKLQPSDWLKPKYAGYIDKGGKHSTYTDDDRWKDYWKSKESVNSSTVHPLPSRVGFDTDTKKATWKAGEAETFMYRDNGGKLVRVGADGRVIEGTHNLWDSENGGKANGDW